MLQPLLKSHQNILTPWVSSAALEVFKITPELEKPRCLYVGLLYEHQVSAPALILTFMLAEHRSRQSDAVRVRFAICVSGLPAGEKTFSVSLQSLCDVRTSRFSKSEDYFCFDTDFLKWQSFVTNLQFMLEQPLHSGLVNLDLNFRFCRCSLDSFCVLSRAASESCTPNYFLSEEGRGHQGTSYVQRSRLCHF